MRRSAWSTLVLSLALFAVVLDRAIQLESLPTAMVTRSVTTEPTPPPAIGVTEGRLTAAIEHDPFHPERRRPTGRFRLPGEPDQPSLAAAPGIASFRLVGTAVMSGGRGFAMCERGPESPRLVRIGERIDDLTLREVAQGKAVFVAADGKRIELQVAKAGT